MKNSARYLFALLAALSVAACGDSSNDANDGSSQLTIALAASGSAPVDAPVVPGQVTVITSAAQLTLLAQGRFPVPASLANYNFAEGDLVYLEGPPDQDLKTTVRISQVSSGPGGQFVNAEMCTTGGRAAGPYRPYALYTTPNLPDYAAFSLIQSTVPCATVGRVATTFVAAGNFPPGVVPVNVPTVIRNQAQLDSLRAQVPGLIVPAEYQAPNFAQVNLVYVQVQSTTSPPSVPDTYVRMVALLDEVDTRYTALVEHCDSPVDFNSTSLYSYALYAVAPISGEVNVSVVYHLASQGCATPR